jgi:hypothetical protein
MDLDKLKADISYSDKSAFSAKWLPQLNDYERLMVELFAADQHGKRSDKAVASYKSLTARYLVTNQLSKGNSGDSQKSALREFIKFGESRWFFNMTVA